MLSLVLVSASICASGQVMKTRKAGRHAAKPECAKGAICFSGEVHEGGEFRKPLTAKLDFIFDLPGSFDVVSTDDKDRCKLSAWVANPPLMAHHATEVDAAYDWTAEQEIQAFPREFRFPMNCADFEQLLHLSETDAGKYFTLLHLLAKGQGRLWITDGKTTHSHDTMNSKNGAIEWVKFTVEIELPTSH